MIIENLPLVSVLMPVYNSEKYIRDAIDSILNQTYRKFELLIIYDSSSDKTEEIVNNYKIKDDRIKVIKNELPGGIIGALNTGFKYSKGDYIARMDSDDISKPDRFECQLEYFETYKNIGLVGTDAEIINGITFHMH